MTELDEQQQVILAAARHVIAEVAPQELPLLAPISAAYFEDPERTVRAATSKDEPLGFGVPAEAEFLTPMVLAMATQVVTFLVAEVTKSARAEAPGVIHYLVKALFKKVHPTKSDGPAPPNMGTALSERQLAQVREIAVEKGRQLGLTANKAELLADSLIGGLALAT